MDNDIFCKNFNLGMEVNIAGTFIYNGLFSFETMKHFQNSEEIFEFLYNISVGIERLFKVSIILVEHDALRDEEEFENKLKTHKHVDLYSRLCNSRKLNLGKVHTEFLKLLSDFYNVWRYDRYMLSEVADYDKEKIALINFLELNLNIKIHIGFFQITPNDIRIKKYVGKLVGKITNTLYRLITEEAHRLNIYTYEIRIDSKADKLFRRKEYDFYNESVIWKEILIYLMNHASEHPSITFINNIEPLLLDEERIAEYIRAIGSNIDRLDIIGEIEQLYKYIEDKKGRLYRLELFDEFNNIHWNIDEEDE